MKDKLDSIEQQLGKKRDFDTPPLHLWDPALSGAIDIRIARDGSWYHEGGKIERESLVRLFASILRREEDGEYYLVTPVEKWKLTVELHPLIVTDVSRLDTGVLQVTLNTGRQVELGENHTLFLEPDVGGVAVVRLPHGLTALFSRAAWYRLVEAAEEVDDRNLIRSGAYTFDLGAVE